MNRRIFIQKAGTLAISVVGSGTFNLTAAENQDISSTHLPRWRGFNLLEKFVKREGGNPPFQEADFIMMQEWGFNFARLPLSYLCWTDPDDWLKLREPELKHLDAVVELGGTRGVHINLNLHRAPGYCVNPPKEPLDLWSEEKALDACAFHWGQLARRFKGIPNSRLSFDLLNEPPDISKETYVRVITRLVQAIRAEDPQRLIIADGLAWGTKPVLELAGLGIAQSTRGYEPMQISHYKASWIHGSDKWDEPAWPLKSGDQIRCDKGKLRKQRIEPWQQLEQKGVSVHVGEWGAFNRTPHKVALAWMADCLALWR